jgi:hypothetical protein
MRLADRYLYWIADLAKFVAENRFERRPVGKNE